MRTVWRITTARFVNSAFSGEGARRYGGRWNPKGWPVVYTAESQSLALLELMVQDAALRAHYVFIPAYIPDALAQTVIEVQDLPSDWRTLGARDMLQALGLAWLKGGQTAILNVPSAVVPGERNFLLNPNHPDFAQIVIGEPQDFQVDIRLLRNLNARDAEQGDW
ncbi:RES family NAD+ phosphorylase [Hydrogenophilus thermoluteolus]|uniref:RES domain-containing protein n=1 Tax=Hydrogenophilus thermoluteolus TaxID=297 RepID=A0A2Z6E1A2_HYDTE|nr:RES domain-containing protein [Hydrogenophilus thermoluteolus]BBD78379.1 RES domain-containing protein [Hydrogenophilus thermoluteolus]